jgi:hypothetical protein
MQVADQWKSKDRRAPYGRDVVDDATGLGRELKAVAIHLRRAVMSVLCSADHALRRGTPIRSGCRYSA